MIPGSDSLVIHKEQVKDRLLDQSTDTNSTERVGVQFGRCFKVREGRCCDVSKALACMVFGGLAIYIGTACAISYANQGGNDLGVSLCVALAVSGLGGLGCGVARTVEISCEVFKKRKARETSLLNV